MRNSVDEVSQAVSRWILNENQRWRQLAYIIANTYPTHEPLKDYLLGLIQGGDTPGIRQLKENLGDEGMALLNRTTLPWTNAWSFVGIDLCTEVGGELKAGEHARLRAILAAFEGGADDE